MGQAFAGKDINQFSRSYSAGQSSAVDLTAAITSNACAASELLCIATATTIRLTYKDASGTSVDTGSITAVVGNNFRIPGAVTELTTNTGLVVLAFWRNRGTKVP